MKRNFHFYKSQQSAQFPTLKGFQIKRIAVNLLWSRLAY